MLSMLSLLATNAKWVQHLELAHHVRAGSPRFRSGMTDCYLRFDTFLLCRRHPTLPCISRSGCEKLSPWGEKRRLLRLRQAFTGIMYQILRGTM